FVTILKTLHIVISSIPIQGLDSVALQIALTYILYIVCAVKPSAVPKFAVPAAVSESTSPAGPDPGAPEVLTSHSYSVAVCPVGAIQLISKPVAVLLLILISVGILQAGGVPSDTFILSKYK